MDKSANASTVSNAFADTKKDWPLNVYIWDMDETLILLKSLLDGTYAEAFNGLKDLRKGIEIGKCWENHILQVCDEYFFYEQIENYNQPYLNALVEYDDGRDLSTYDFSNDGLNHLFDDVNKRKLAYRQRAIAQKYAQGLRHVLSQQLIEHWNDLYNMADSYSDKWLSSAHDFLEQMVAKNKASGLNQTGCRHINVLVTSGALIPSLVKCLLFRLDDVLSCDSVYSSWEVGKLQCFTWIKEHFSGTGVQFCVIGDGMEECMAAEKMNWPFIQIDFRPDGIHRFPGLTPRMVEHYIDVVYEPPGDGNDKD